MSIRRSSPFPLSQALAALAVALSLVLLPIGVAKIQENQDNYNTSVPLFIMMFGGSFLGTTAFWLAFDCDFLRRKKIKKLEENDNKLKEKLDNNLSAFNKSIDELKGELKEILERFPQKPDSQDKSTKESTET